MTVDEFPPHLKRELDRMSNEEEEEKRRREMERSTCKVSVDTPVLGRRVDTCEPCSASMRSMCIVYADQGLRSTSTDTEEARCTLGST
jgi:hypothetical protein